LIPLIRNARLYSDPNGSTNRRTRSITTIEEKYTSENDTNARCFLTRFGDVSTALFVSTTGQHTTVIDRTARPLLGIARPRSFSLLDAHSSPTIRQDYFTFSAKKRRRRRIKQSLHPQGMTTGTSPHKTIATPVSECSHSLAATQTNRVLLLQQGLPHIYGPLGYKV
jgi:hypothetical protein